MQNRSKHGLGLAALAFLMGMVPEGRAQTSDPDALIVDIEFRGLRRVEEDTAKSGMRSVVGDPIDPETVTEDLRTLWAKGFFRDISISREVTPGGSILVVTVVEKPSIRAVEFRGNDAVSDDDIKGVVDVKPFTILNVELLKRNIAKIKDLYVEKGYYLAEITYDVEPVVGSQQEVNVFFDVVENTKVVVKQIEFVGNDALTDDEIKSVLQTREGSELSWLTQSGTYKEEFFQTDIFRIQALYYDQGFVAIRVGEPTATISRDRRFIYLSVPIEEGERYNLGAITFAGDVELKDESGNVVVDAERLRRRLSIDPGETFNRTRLFEDIQRLTNIYRDQGYAYANVTPNSRLNPEERLVDLELEVERGDLVYIERIEVVGNTRTRDKVIRRELRVFEGDRYSASGLERSRARVFQLGFFETVDVTTSRGSAPDRMNVTIEIKEKSTGTFQIGAGFSSAESFIATAQISQNNFLGHGQLLSLSAQLSFGDFARQLATLQFFEPYFLDTLWSLGFNAYAQQRFFRDFQRNANGFSPTVGYPITPDLRLSVGYTLEWIEISTDFGDGNGGAAIFNLNRDGRNSSISATLSYDTRDNRLFPSRGLFQVATFEVSHPVLGTVSDLKHNRLQLTSRFYYPLFLGFVARLNASLGYVFGGGDQGVPVSERFFPGGIFSVRGFPPRGLGPTVSTLRAGDPASEAFDFVIGGNKELIFNFEIEFPILAAAGIKGVIFADAGNAYDDNENFLYLGTPKSLIPRAFLIGAGEEIDPPLGLYYSFGFGFRWFSPIGPLRFEWGIPITKKRRGDDDTIFEFTIGNFF